MMGGIFPAQLISCLALELRTPFLSNSHMTRFHFMPETLEDPLSVITPMCAIISILGSAYRGHVARLDVVQLCVDLI